MHQDRCVLSTSVEVWREASFGVCLCQLYGARHGRGLRLLSYGGDKGGDEKEKGSGSLTRLRDEDGLRLLCNWSRGSSRGSCGEKRQRKIGKKRREVFPVSRGYVAVWGNCQQVLRQVLLRVYFNSSYLVLLIFLTFLLSFLF